MTRANLHTELSQWLHRQWLSRGWLSLVMRPFSWVVLLILAIRRKFYLVIPERVYHPPLPVLVIGNIYVGGTGKTPVVIALVKALIERGWHPGVISRGYGVNIGSSPRVGRAVLDPEKFADEPALIAEQTGASVAVHPNRKKAIESLLAYSPEIDLIISDDGLQHLALHRELEIVVQDLRKVGNGLVMPAGPLRESIHRLDQVQAIITNISQLPESGAMTPSSASGAGQGTRPRSTDMTLRTSAFRNLMSQQTLNLAEFKKQMADQPLAAAAGIGSPERFFNSLRSQGLSLNETLALPDHHTFTRDTFSTLQSHHILITAKDAIKCQQLNDSRLWVVEVDAVFSDPAFTDWLSSTLREQIKPMPPQ